MQIKIQFSQVLESCTWEIRIDTQDEDIPIFMHFDGTHFWDHMTGEEFDLYQKIGLSKEDLIDLCYKEGTPTTPEYKDFKPYCLFYHEESGGKLCIITPRGNFRQVTDVLDLVEIKYEPPNAEAWFGEMGPQYSWSIKIEEKLESYQFCDRMWPHRGNNVLIPPTAENPFLQNKLLWRYVVRPITGEEGTPVEVNTSHKAALELERERILKGEYDRNEYQEGRVFVGSLDAKNEILPILNTLLYKIERIGFCHVMD